jgi:long-chain acyl-CoA synthetase
MDPKEVYLSRPWLAYYPQGVPADIEVEEISVPGLFDRVSERYAKKDALVFYGRRISYQELRDKADRFSAALADLGVSKGDTVALYLLNCPQYVIAYFGALKAGAKVTPISPVYTSKEVRHQLEDSEAKTVVCEEMLYDNVEKSEVRLNNVILTSIGDYLPPLKKLFGKSALAAAYSGARIPSTQYRRQAGLLGMEELIKKAPPRPPAVAFEPSLDIAALPYTGGTTGLPKAAVLTHSNMVALQRQTTSFWPIFEEGKEVGAAFLPFFHIYGQVVVMLSGLVQGSTLILFTTPDVEEILDSMEKYRVSAFYGVPTLFEYLKEHEKTGRVNWKRLKLIACGADTLHESTVADWERRTGTRILEGYGMTETTAVSHSTPFNRPKAGSFGVPLPSVMAAVVEVEGDACVPVGEVGELILSGPNIMQGYWKRPKETAESMFEMGGRRWLRTGDLVRMDEEGYFHFFDRKRDLIKYKGYSVFARHVEEVLYKHPQVKAAGVVGVPDPKVGQIVKAYVVLQSEARGKLSEEDIIEFCKQNLAHYKVPRIVEFRGELPKTDVGKVSRRELREEADEG